MDIRKKAAVGASAAAVVAVATTLVMLTTRYYNVYLPIVYAPEARHGVSIPNQTGACQDVALLNGEWIYDWGSDNPCPDLGLEFVPMAWSIDYAQSLSRRTWPVGVFWILGYNEPNYRGQGICTPQQAAAAWHFIEETGLRTVSPAVAACTPGTDSNCIQEGLSWLSQFLALVGNGRVDAIAVHWYGCKARDLFDYLDAVHRLAPSKPIWLTEFACTIPYGVSIEGFMQATIPHLAEHNVVRYAWFTTRQYPDWWYIVPLVDNGGQLTSLGQTYKQYGRHI